MTYEALYREARADIAMERRNEDLSGFPANWLAARGGFLAKHQGECGICAPQAFDDALADVREDWHQARGVEA